MDAPKMLDANRTNPTNLNDVTPTIDAAKNVKRKSRSMIGAAVYRSKLLSAEGLRERLFALAFSNLVYPQIWEDPEVDLEALALDSGSRVITIASGGCNVLSYLTAEPAHITAVDINAAHVALNRLKLAAAQHLPDYNAFYRFFGAADTKANVEAFKRYILPHLDAATAAYWYGRHGLRRRRRIRRFANNFYRAGLLGSFIGASHLVARLHGVNPRALLKARTLEEQRHIFEREFAPLFNSRTVRWIVNRPASLYGLGIPPAQYTALIGDMKGGMADVLRQRLERLACGFPLTENYFAWQAFGRRYPQSENGPLPPYLNRANFDAVRRNARRVEVHHVSMTAHLAASPAASYDRYILLDAQDWMGDADLTHLWSEITRTARPGARVIFRTAAEPTILPGRVPDEILSRWDYADDLSAKLTQKDRSAIYGGFHVYMLKA
jgi:S-adenosylmethionine-diacylglycerol 3-amino-3-carboxypropyl transferase